MVYTAVGCLVVAALGDLIKEVINAIQACGDQMTANGRLILRTGGGLLWNIIKAREPKAYKEIMKKTREFAVQYQPLFYFKETVFNLSCCVIFCYLSFAYCI